MSEAFRCRSVLICDEIREEVGGKEIIIGAYSGVILLPFVPFFTFKLTIRFEVNASRSHFDHAECTILRPNGSIFSHDSKTFNVKFPEFPSSIVFLLGGLNFEHTGEYGVLLAMDSAPMPVGSFSIVTPETLPQRD